MPTTWRHSSATRANFSARLLRRAAPEQGELLLSALLPPQAGASRALGGAGGARSAAGLMGRNKSVIGSHESGANGWRLRCGWLADLHQYYHSGRGPSGLQAKWPAVEIGPRRLAGRASCKVHLSLQISAPVRRRPHKLLCAPRARIANTCAAGCAGCFVQTSAAADQIWQ